MAMVFVIQVFVPQRGHWEGWLDHRPVVIFWWPSSNSGWRSSTGSLQSTGRCSDQIARIRERRRKYVIARVSSWFTILPLLGFSVMFRVSLDTSKWLCYPLLGLDLKDWILYWAWSVYYNGFRPTVFKNRFTSGHLFCLSPLFQNRFV